VTEAVRVGDIDAKGKSTDPSQETSATALDSPSKIRCALTRIAFGVLSGRIPPQRANAAVYAISAAGKILELETLDRGITELARRNDLRGKALRYYDAEVAGSLSVPVMVPEGGHE
jgi:hypothetical protein